MEETTSPTNGSSQLPFDVGPAFEGWERQCSLISPNGKVLAVILEAPEDIETTDPLAFLFRPEDNPEHLVTSVAPSLFYLGTQISSLWAFTDALETIPEAPFAGFLSILFARAAEVTL